MKNRVTFQIQELPEHIQLNISGTLDEYAIFPELKSSEYRDLLFDMGEFQSINSMGIRSWIEWFQTFKFRKVVFKKCPKVFIDQVNNVEGFIPANSLITSFFVPYYSEASDEDAQILFVRGEHFTLGQLVQLPQVLDSLNREMEIDILLEKYLRFLPYFTK